jgi:hypothetical protein
MRVATALCVALLVVATTEPLRLGAQPMTRDQRLRMEEHSLKRRLAGAQADAERRQIEALLLRVQAEMIQPDALKGVVVVRDTCNLPDGSMYRAGDSTSYAGQRYRCADVYDQTLTRTGVSWIKVFQE